MRECGKLLYFRTYANTAHALSVIIANATTNTQNKYIIITAFSPQQWLRKRTSLLNLYVFCLPSLH
jgi:hypothetical protein